jgi:hypothetical protein
MEASHPDVKSMQQATSAPMRRQFERTAVRANIFVHCSGRFQHARVVDYSAGGLRLEGTFGLLKRDAVHVELISGIRISAKVAWSLGAQTGLVFAEPLSSTHPGLAQLARRAAPLVAA